MNMLQIAVFIALLASMTYLSIPGVIRYHPVFRTVLMTFQSILWQRLIAIVLMIIVVLATTSGIPDWLHINLGATISIIASTVLIPLGAYMVTRADIHTGKLVQFNGLHIPSLQGVICSVFTILYMMLYEVILRGIVFYFLIDWMGLIFAILLTTLIYVVMHLPKDRTEAILCIPVGIVLCTLTYATGSIWPAAVFHALLAVSFEYFYSRKAALSMINPTAQ